MLTRKVLRALRIAKSIPSSTPGSFVVPKEKSTGLVFTCQPIRLFKLEALCLDSIRKLWLYTCTRAREHNHIMPASVSGVPLNKMRRRRHLREPMARPKRIFGSAVAASWILATGASRFGCSRRKKKRHSAQSLQNCSSGDAI